MLEGISRLDIKQELARRKHERFMSYCWQKTSTPLIVGRHTKAICKEIDKAIIKFKKGESSFLLITVPFRHGKSDMVSRYLPPHFLGEFPDGEVMLTTYAASLAEGFNRFGRTLLKSEQFKSLYPGINVDRQNAGVQAWGIDGQAGLSQASGLSSGITGKGYHLGILDDFCASREQAESEVIRNKLWASFSDDFLTRRAPVSITIVLATPWHTDDIIGRIKSRNDPSSKDYIAEFPKFKQLSFPAMDGQIEVETKKKVNGKTVVKTEIQKYKYLFPERFNETWYKQQFATLGEYSASGLLQCNPMLRGGNIINCNHIQKHSNKHDFPDTKYYRVWDMAHTAKQTQKSDPDWTAGTLLAFRKIGEVWELWIKDVARIRNKAPERDRFIQDVADSDGESVTIAVENSLDSKDAVAAMQNIFNGKRVVKGIQTKGDKIARVGYIEPIFEAGNVHILMGDWYLDWLKEVKEFPSGKHDDQVDNLSAGFTLVQNTLVFTDEQVEAMQRARQMGY